VKRALLTLLAIVPAACGATPASSAAHDASFAAPETSAELPPRNPPAPSDAQAGPPDVALTSPSPDAPTDARVETAAVSPTDVAAPADAGPLPAPQAVGYPAGSAPRTEQKSIVGPTTHQTIGFNVYLPPGYDSGALRYPVVYDLHGLTGNQFEDPQWVVPSLEAAMKKNLIGPVIVVFPDGLMQSYYADSADGRMPSETRIIRELIPYVDATYRTVAHRQLRAVTGFSMGGYGAMEFATKFPELFRVGVAYDAALDTWQTLVMRRAAIAQATFGDQETYFDKYSPWAFSTANAAVLRAQVALRLVPGPTYQMFDAAFRDHLQGLPVPLDYVETTCPHDYGCAIGAQGAQSWTFIQAAFAD
jgi:S-formylglutathione hydrolase FrmB